jgi:hypothetical protein
MFSVLASESHMATIAESKSMWTDAFLTPAFLDTMPGGW